MNKVEKIKKLADAMYNRMQNLTTDTSGIRKAMDEYHQFIINEYYKEDTEKDFGIKSSDLEEAAHSYVDTTIEWFNPEGNPCCYPAFIAGAQWQKERDQSTIELAEDHAYLAGQEKIIAKACEWLENYFKGVSSGTVYLEDFKKAIKE